MKKNNKTHNQYQGYFKKIKKTIKNIKDDRNISYSEKKEKIFDEFYNFLSEDLPEDATIINEISEIIDDNREFASGIIRAFTQDLIDREEPLPDIGAQISKIVNTNRIKRDLNLVSDIIGGFVKYSLEQFPEYIDSVAEAFSNSLNGTEDKIKKKCEPIFSLILSQHFMNNRLRNSIFEKLSEEKKKEAQQELVKRHYKLNLLTQAQDKQEFQDIEQNIQLKKLSDLQEEYLEEQQNKKDAEEELSKCYNKHFRLLTNFIQYSSPSTNPSRPFSQSTNPSGLFSRPTISLQPSRPSTILSKNGKDTIRELPTEASNTGKQGAKKNNSSLSKRHEQKKQQGDRSR